MKRYYECHICHKEISEKEAIRNALDFGEKDPDGPRMPICDECDKRNWSRDLRHPKG